MADKPPKGLCFVVEEFLLYGGDHMSKLETEAIRIFLSDMKHARKIKASVIRLAQEEPERVIDALSQLEQKDQKYLSYLRRIAEESLAH